MASENHDRAKLCTYKLFGDAMPTRTVEVTICMILRRTARSPSTVTEPPKWIVTHNVDCQRDSSKTNARHREIASTEVYPSNALSPNTCIVRSVTSKATSEHLLPEKLMAMSRWEKSEEGLGMSFAIEGTDSSPIRKHHPSEAVRHILLSIVWQAGVRPEA